MLLDHLFSATDRKNALQMAHPVHFAFCLIDHAPGAGKAGCREDGAVKFLVQQEEIREFLVFGCGALLGNAGFKTGDVFQRVPLGRLDDGALFQLEPDEAGFHVTLHVDRRDIGTALRYDSHETFFGKANDRLAHRRLADMQERCDFLFRQCAPGKQLHFDNQFAKQGMDPVRHVSISRQVSRGDEFGQRQRWKFKSVRHINNQTEISDYVVTYLLCF